ncbi:MAG: acyclic terpene utilization AtuA family protein [Lachnospiraceae bacterium]|nr:acyclic terpene utilization AtuA family protein [Lachnospiraceae bacterium]MBR4060046.1 acyclic terpene utilization AtuA family protein [Lachnospiraceae bacterium]
MKIIALNGLLGYGYTEKALENAFANCPDYIGVDAGSTDPGPYYLGSGNSFTNRNSVKRDLELALPTAVERKIPFIIGTAGGSGAKPHVDWLCSIVDEIAEEHQLSMKVAVIYADVSKEYVMKKFRDGKISAMGPLDSTEESIAQSNRLVAQLSVEPVIHALESGADLIICGRLCDTAIYASPAIMHGFDPGLAFHMAKIMECGSMCSEPVSASDVMLGEITEDSFTLTPMNPIRRCTVRRVAAHTMYEQSDPVHIYEPDGVIDLTESQYEQITERSVKVRGSRFIPAPVKTLKLEGTRLAGYRTIAIAGINDLLTIVSIETIEQGVREFLKENFKAYSEDDYRIIFRKYGPTPEDVHEEFAGNLGLIIDVVAKSEEIADAVCAVARSRVLHYDYAGRKSTAGNLAFPYSPSDIHMGEVYEFSMYHLCQVDDFAECSQTVWREYNHGKVN